MPRWEPDHRGRAVLTAVSQGLTEFRSENPLETALFHLVKNKQVVQLDVEEAYALYREPGYRHAVNAVLIAKGDDALLSQGMEIASLVVSAYRHLFFDRSVFRHVLDMVSWINNLAVTDEHRNYYAIANQQGPEALVNMFRIGDKPEIDPKVVLNQVMVGQYQRFQEHRGLPITDPIAQAALRAGREASVTAVMMIDKGGAQAKHALEDLKGALSLETKDHTQSPEDAGIDMKTVAG